MLVINSGVRLCMQNTINKANLINSTYKRVDIGKIVGLKAAEQFASEEYEIYALLGRYLDLITKDMKEGIKIINNIENVDRIIAKEIESSVS